MRLGFCEIFPLGPLRKTGEYASWVENFRDDIARELDRITTRLTGLNGVRLEATKNLVHTCANEIFSMSQSVGTEKPPVETQLPEVGNSAVAAQLIVVTRDYLSTPPSPADEQAFELLTQLRRALP